MLIFFCCRKQEKVETETQRHSESEYFVCNQIPLLVVNWKIKPNFYLFFKRKLNYNRSFNILPY